jgi:spore maturation protein CgeB
MNFREYLKKFSLLYWLNSILKAGALSRDLAKLTSYYNKKATEMGYAYSPSRAVIGFKERCILRNPCFEARSIGHLRVFWIGANKDQDESGFLQALHRIGKITTFVNIEGEYGIWYGKNNTSISDIRATNDKALLDQIRCAHSEGGIDLLLGQMWAGLISKEALSKVQSMGIPVVNIAMDDRLPVHWSTYNGIRLGSIGLSPGTDMVLTTCSETCLWYGIEHCPALFWPLASDPTLFAPSKEQIRDIDVLFIGNCYGIRGEIVSYLQQNGINVECYGRGWANGYVDAAQNTELSKRARIILGIGTVGHCKDVYTLKLRDFDALMTGALYITHRNPDLCQIFQEGNEIECYESPQELAKKIKYYLDNPLERERIGNAGQQKAVTYHNWDERLITTFRQLGMLQ